MAFLASFRTTGQTSEHVALDVKNCTKNATASVLKEYALHVSTSPRRLVPGVWSSTQGPTLGWQMQGETPQQYKEIPNKPSKEVKKHVCTMYTCIVYFLVHVYPVQ